MANYKEIVTKTVKKKEKKRCKNKLTITPEQMPSTVLGCWVINHAFSGTNNLEQVKIIGSYDVNVWYSYDSDHKTAVSSKTYNYEESMNVPVRNKSSLNNNSEIIVRSLKQPQVADVKIEGSNVVLEVENELGVEIVGDEKIKVNIEDNYDDYDEIIDEDEIDNVVNEVNEEYLNSVNQN